MGNIDQNKWYRVVCKNSGRVLDVEGGGGNSARIQIYDWLGGNNQQWKLEPVGNGFYKIIAKHNGKVLDVEMAGKNNGDKVQLYDWNQGEHQQFKLDPTEDGYFKIVARHSGKVLDVEGYGKENTSKIQQWDSLKGGDNQDWKFESADVPPTPLKKFPLKAGTEHLNIIDGCNMRANLVLSEDGNLTATVETWTTNTLSGFHGGIRLVIITEAGDGWVTPFLIRYGVDGTAIPGKADSRTDIEQWKVPGDIARHAAQVCIHLTHEPQDRFGELMDELLKKVGKFADTFNSIKAEIGPIINFLSD